MRGPPDMPVERAGPVAAILTIGDELLIGQVVDRNAAWLASSLNHLGIQVATTVTVGDDRPAIGNAIVRCLNAANVVIVTGGLGPTPDDVTRDAIADVFQVPLRVNADVLESIQERFAARGGREVTSGSNSVALIPQGFDVLPNPVGTAPGLWYESEQGEVIALLPGVPHEMRTLFREELAPRLSALPNRSPVMHRTLQTAGVGETELQRRLGHLATDLPHGVSLAFLPGPNHVRLRISSTLRHADSSLDALERSMRMCLGDCVFGTDTDTLEGILGNLLQTRGYTIAAAESCTGGLVMDRLTNTPGSSAYVAGGVVSYSNELKIKLLDVDPDMLALHGAVSEQVALQMAIGVRKHLDTHVGISVTGIAGPSGGSLGKPVGTVWVGYADPDTITAQLCRFGQDRRRNKERSVVAALDLARRMLQQF